MIIYKTTNLINNKFYIGLDTKNKPSYLGSGIYLVRAVKKYGKENFKKEIIEYCNSTDELQKREIFWIAKLKPHYNISLGGFGNINPSKETRKKLSIAVSGNKNPMYGKKGELNPFFGKEHSAETKKKISKKMKGRKSWLGKKHTEKTKKKISENHINVSGSKNPMFGVNRYDMRGENNFAKRPEVRKILSEQKMGDKNPAKRSGVKAKISKTLKGRIPWNKGKTNIFSEEALKNMSESKKGQTAWNKGQPRSQATKDKISKTKLSKKFKHSEETKIKMAKDRKGRVAWNKGLKYKHKILEGV